VDETPPTNECKYFYGAASSMYQPTRLHCHLAGRQTTMRMETDAGKQTRVFRFGKARRLRRGAARTWQGSSAAVWGKAGEPTAGSVCAISQG